MEESACCAEVGISPGARPASARGCIWLLYEMRYIPDNSLQRAFSYCVYFYSSRRDLLEIQCAASRCSGGVLPLTTRCCWVLGCVMRQAHLMLPGLMCSGEFGVLLLLVLLCCVCGPYHRVVACRLLCSISGAEFARAEFAHELTAFAARVLSWLGVCSRRL